MLPVRNLPTFTDDDGTPRLSMVVADRQIVAVLISDPDDGMTSEQLKADWRSWSVARSWPEPMFYELKSGRVEAWYWTHGVVRSRHYYIKDELKLSPLAKLPYYHLDATGKSALAPGVTINGRKNYATFDGDIIPKFPQSAIELIAEEEREYKARETERAERFNGGLQDAIKARHFDRASGPVCGSSWPWLEEMNARHAVTQHGNRTMVHEVVQDFELGHERHSWTTCEDFASRYRNRFVDVPTPSRNGIVNVSTPLGKAWLESADRRQYDTEVFAPNKEVPANALNLWRDWAVRPQPGHWHRFRAHIQNVICDGNEMTFQYVLCWLARMAQRPGEPGGVAITLRGTEGIGKGKFADRIQRLAGMHGIHISQARHLTGNFNAHLHHKVFAFVDEAYFAGDPEIRGPLFALITEPRLQIERKGVDAHAAANYLHIVMATNEDWAIPASLDSRRFLVLQVSSKRRNDSRYFAALDAEMAAGGLEAMLSDLLAMDISDFNVFDVPQTEALAEQKIFSLRGPERWLFECMQRGYVRDVLHEDSASTSRSFVNESWDEKGYFAGKEETYQAYRRWATDNKERVKTDAMWAKSCKTLLGECWARGERPAQGERKRRLALAGLTKCRAVFEQKFGQKIEWDSVVQPTDAPSATNHEPESADEIFD